MFLQPGTTAQHQQLATINGSRVNIYLALSASYHQAHIITNANKMFAQICWKASSMWIYISACPGTCNCSGCPIAPRAKKGGSVTVFQHFFFFRALYKLLAMLVCGCCRCWVIVDFISGWHFWALDSSRWDSFPRSCCPGLICPEKGCLAGWLVEWSVALG